MNAAQSGEFQSQNARGTRHLRAAFGNQESGHWPQAPVSFYPGGSYVQLTARIGQHENFAWMLRALAAKPT